MPHVLEHTARPLIKLAFKEDLGDRGDITTLAIGVTDHHCSASIIARQKGVIAGIDLLTLAFHEIDPEIDLTFAVKDGDAVRPDQLLAKISGAADRILIAERTALNFFGHLSGIATLTRQFVDAVAGLKTKLLDTRKTIPGWRSLEKYAVRCGGGENHRMGLYDMFLIKENHIAAAGGLANAVRRCRDFMRTCNFKAEIEVEAQNLQDVKDALSLRVDRILLDNMPLNEIAKCVEFVNYRIPLEVSGNVSLATVRAIGETGVDYISIGALTHSAKNFDVSLLF
ncbi:carboxylating nicotinate-nucleotide diphosphorylase [candidate division KSB1 bacterium]|nr:carboxylating nicotinate-nucleotide diphosphorylase [candidate division KSB1 bacterium]RQW05576.1 MAG: carboxylating nicotinate-nucleotide diphosphorylase [candidate division KSB1 bacterium]